MQATQVWVALQCAAPVPVQFVSERHCTHALVPGSQYGLGGAHVPLVVQGVPPAASAPPPEPLELASAPPDELPDEAASALPEEEPLPLPLLDAVVASSPAPEPVPDDAPELAPLDPPSGETVLSLPDPPQPIPIAIIKDNEESTLDGFIFSSGTHESEPSLGSECGPSLCASSPGAADRKPD